LQYYVVETLSFLSISALEITTLLATRCHGPCSMWSFCFRHTDALDWH